MTEENRSRRFARLSALIGLVSAMCAAGCAFDEVQEASAIEETTLDVLPIYGGVTAPPVGVVAITMGDGYECSGVMISRAAVLTAAHCVRSSGVRSGEARDVQASIVFTKADGRLVCLTESAPVVPLPPRDPQCAHKATYRASAHLWATARNANSDLAILTRDVSFVNISNSEVAHIELSKPSGDRLEFHGYGYFDGSRATGGSARTGSSPVDRVEENFVEMDVRGARPCIGDSGGPLTELFADTSPNLLVAGVSSWTDASFNGCPPSNTPSYFTRIKPNLDFIERALGYKCDRVTVRFGSGTKDAARCFRVANINPPKR